MRWPLEFRVSVAALAVTGAAIYGFHLSNPHVEGAETTVNAAAKLLSTHALARDAVDWPNATKKALALVGKNPRESNVELAINSLIDASQERHTFYLDAKTYQRLTGHGKASSVESLGRVEFIEPQIPMVSLTTYSVINTDTAERDAAALRREVVAALAQTRCGVIVDLSRNSGGNMYPMLGAVATMLPSGPLGFHAYPAGDRIAILRPPVLDSIDRQVGPVAIISGPLTGSSGEFVLIALRAIPQSRVFGQPSAGFTTGNIPIELPNGGAMAVTVSRLHDSHGHLISGNIQPDQFESDVEQARRAAVKWLRSVCA